MKRIVTAAALSVLLLWTHRDNLRRLAAELGPEAEKRGERRKIRGGMLGFGCGG